MADNTPILPPDAETRQTRRAKLTKGLGARIAENLWLKVTAVVLAMLLWYVIVQKEPSATLIPVRLRLQLDSTLALQGALPEINAFVQGRPSELARLEGRFATITRAINAQRADTLVISLNPGDVVLPGIVDARVADVRPRQIRLEFVPTLTRMVPVRSALRVAAVPGAAPPTLSIEPLRVEISGPRLAVLRVAFVRTDTTLILQTDSIPHQVALDTAGLGVTVKPDQARVRLVPRPPL